MSLRVKENIMGSCGNYNKDILKIYSQDHPKILIKARHLLKKNNSRVGMGDIDQIWSWHK